MPTTIHMTVRQWATVPAIGEQVEVIEHHHLGQPPRYHLGVQNVIQGHAENGRIYNRCGLYRITALAVENRRLDADPCYWGTMTLRQVSAE